MTAFKPLKTLPQSPAFKKGDVLVLFGELFTRGYANGLVEEAQRQGMLIVRATVGRREKDGSLRPLNSEESQNIPTPFINVPLEAGFDMDPALDGSTPVDQLKEIKLTDWQSAKLNWKSIEESRQAGKSRFKKQVQNFMTELEPHIKPGASVCFAHLMAGGVPRAKVIMPLMNRVFKGTGDRHISSEVFWNSELGKLCAMSFNEVTAETYRHLIEGSSFLRKKIESTGGKVSYLAYGYHGTEILINRKLEWQTYTPYLQGWAKMQLEAISEEFFKHGVKSTVYNCPEILTNSSSIFVGVEISLYPLVTSLQILEKPNPHVQKTLEQCRVRLKEMAFDKLEAYLNSYLTNPHIKNHCDFQKWPQHNTADQMEVMITGSDELVTMHSNEKELVTQVLSEAVFVASGSLMLNSIAQCESPVLWLGHDIIAQQLNR